MSQTGKEVLAVVPARGGSKSIKKKNIVELDGKPLLEYTLTAAKESTVVDRTVLSTDDKQIAAVGESFHSVEVPFIRPQKLAQDDTPTLPVIQHAVNFLQEQEAYIPDIVLILQPTSPLRQPRHIDEAIKKMINSEGDSVVSVIQVPHEFNPYSVMEIEDGWLEFYLEEGRKYTRRQDKPTFYARNGAAIYGVSLSTLLKDETLYGDACIPYVMDRKFSVDIDTEFDLMIAEAILETEIVEGLS